MDLNKKSFQDQRFIRTLSRVSNGALIIMFENLAKRQKEKGYQKKQDLIRAEGRKRGMLYFLTGAEQNNLLSEIFNPNEK